MMIVRMLIGLRHLAAGVARQTVVAAGLVPLSALRPATYIGKGKVEELAGLVKSLKAGDEAWAALCFNNNAEPTSDSDTATVSTAAMVIMRLRHRFDSSVADMNRRSESSVGMVSPALSSLS